MVLATDSRPDVLELRSTELVGQIVLDIAAWLCPVPVTKAMLLLNRPQGYTQLPPEQPLLGHKLNKHSELMYRYTPVGAAEVSVALEVEWPTAYENIQPRQRRGSYLPPKLLKPVLPPKPPTPK